MSDQLIWTKDPQASLRYGFDVADLLAPGDSVTAASIQAQDGITATDAQFAGTEVYCRVSGGVVGQSGSVVLRWTTTQGDVDERTLAFNIEQQ